jgi:uncharacterized protein YkwD
LRVLCFLLLTSVAHADAPVAAHVEELIKQLSSGRVQRDAKLSAVAAQLLDAVPAGTRPSNDLVEASMWLNGFVEPPPHLIFDASFPDDDRRVLDNVRAELGPLLRDHNNYRKLGVGVRRVADALQVVVALGESSIDLADVPRSLGANGSVDLLARILPPYQKPAAFVTGPDGKVSPVPLDARPTDGATTVRGQVRCGAKQGAHQIEITGEDRFGPTVLANFPIYCGIPAPNTLAAARVPTEAPPASAAQAEADIARLVNADRAKAGLRPLTVDAQLADVARKHSTDMRDHNFFGHISPRTGSAEDRLRRADIGAHTIRENVAMGYTSGEVERGLMASPGHRANILDKDVSRLGVGVALNTQGGIAVTQLFTRPLDRADDNAVKTIRARVDAARQAQGLDPLRDDAMLDDVAARAVDDVLAGKKPGGAVEQALPTIGKRFAAVRTAVASAGSIDQLGDSVLQAASARGVSHLGIALREGKRDGSLMLYAVFILAEGRTGILPP